MRDQSCMGLEPSYSYRLQGNAAVHPRDWRDWRNVVLIIVLVIHRHVSITVHIVVLDMKWALRMHARIREKKTR